MSVPAAALAVVVALAGCAGASAPRSRILARGTLAYAVAPAGDRLVSIELDVRFALVVRAADTSGNDEPPVLRVDLGPPERDLVALAVAGDVAYVGGSDRAVRRVDLSTGRITATWPVGAAVTALAAHRDLIAVGDDSGALCLRRAGDGALLQCVVAGAGSITSLTLVGDDLITGSGRGALRWRLPSLISAGPTRLPPTMWADGEVVIRGRTVEIVAGGRRRRLATMAGQVRAIAVLPGRRLAIAAWVRQLDNPSIIVVAPLD